MEADQLGCQGGEPLVLPLRPTVRNGEVLALDIPEVAQLLPEGIDRRVVIRAGKARTEEPNPVHVRCLLRLRSACGDTEAESEDEHEPQSAQRHGGVLQQTRGYSL